MLDNKTELRLVVNDNRDIAIEISENDFISIIHHDKCVLVLCKEEARMLSNALDVVSKKKRKEKKQKKQNKWHNR